MPFLLFFLLFLLIPVGNSYAQTGSFSNDSLRSYPVSLYKKATETSQNLYTGRRYYLYDSQSLQHQFLGDRTWYVGNVYFDGQQFDSIPMMYDINKQQLIIRDLEANFLILSSEFVNSFSFDHRFFRRLVAGVDLPASMETKFYQILYNGPSHFIVYRKKNRQEEIKDMQVIQYYEIKDDYYVKKGNDYWLVSSKKSLYSLFPTYKKELRKYVRQQKLDFSSTTREQSMIELIKYYDEIAVR